MTEARVNSWQDVHREVLHRVRSGEWKPGEMIPFEADLAAEFGCARSTVNRALRALADDGLLARRRRAGTRVQAFPVRKATLSIPIIRHEIEGQGLAFSYRLVAHRIAPPPAAVRRILETGGGSDALHVVGLYLADGAPYVCEDRWVSLDAVPAARRVDLARRNLNEWLVGSAPFTGGDISILAAVPRPVVSKAIGSARDEAVLTVERTTRNEGQVVTFVRLHYPPGHRLRTTL